MRPQPSASGLWVGRLGGPAARFLTDDGDHEFVIERAHLAPELSRYYAAQELSAELRGIVEAWGQPVAADAPLIAELPVRWRSFANIATELIEQGKGYFRCNTCQEIYPATDLKKERYQGGCEFVTVNTHFVCPRGHILLTREAHFRMRLAARAARS